MTDTQLKQAFDLVKSKKDWKDPIRAWCKTSEIERISRAVIHYTATEPIFTSPITVKKGEEFSRFKAGNVVCIVTADGYRMGPAGDH